MTAPLTRRSVLVGSVVTVIGGIAGYAAARSTDAAKAAPPGTVANGYGGPPSSGGTKTGGGTLLTPLSKVPKGGGVVIASQKVVVTQDTSGTVHGFSAVCTHQGCLVSQVSGGTIDCPCHGSKFNADTGAVVNGPATSPLPAVAVTVKGGNVYGA